MTTAVERINDFASLLNINLLSGMRPNRFAHTDTQYQLAASLRLLPAEKR